MSKSINQKLVEFGLRIEVKKISDLKRYPGNPRIHDERSIEAIQRSIETFGFKNVVVVDSDYEVIAGHGRLDALKQIGKTKVPVLVATDLDKWQAAALRIADNRTTELSTWDEEKLANEVKELEAGLSEEIERLGSEDVDLTVLGFEQKKMEAFLTDEEEEMYDNSVPIYNREEIIKRAFRYYKETGFPYPEKVPIHIAMQEINTLAAMPTCDLLMTLRGLKVADGYHPHRFDGIASGRTWPPSEIVNKDKYLKHALEFEYESMGRIPEGRLSAFNLTSAQAFSNFRPGLALYYYRKYCPEGGVILDTSMGYGGRLVAAIAFQPGLYIGIDPATVIYEANERLVAGLGFKKQFQGFCLPVEDVNPRKLKAKADLAFTSPPYFSKERYSNEKTQSFIRYPEPEVWRDGFLKRMLALQWEALKRGGYNIVNIADVNIGKDKIPLEAWFKALAAQQGFELEAIEKLPFRGGRCGKHLTVGGLKSEPIFVLRKP